MHPSYREAVVRYLAFLAVVCAIAGLHVGPGVILVWLLTAFALLWRGRGLVAPPPSSRCRSRKRRKRF